MSSKRYARAREVFLAARGLAEPERARLVAGACGGDGALRAMVDELLAHDSADSSFLESPALGVRVDAAEVEPADELAPGARVGPYRIRRLLGEGGFGAVYEAEQERPLRRRVALKLLKPGMDSRAVLARFQAESEALARMDHAHVAKVFDAGASESGRPFFALELVDGEPITAFCARHALGLAARVELVRRVCGAVQHAHQKGLIHRDLKPSNVLVGGSPGDPQPKVIDFGVAKAIGGDAGERSALTQAGVLLGTPAYMSPEQAGADARDVDTRSDVYALGALLYELLCGSPPFDAERLRRASLAEIARILRDEEPPPPSVRAARDARAPIPARKLRREMDWIVLRALEKDRERRYGSPAELAADLTRWLAHEPVLAGPPSARYRALKFARRNRLAVAAVAALVVAMTGGLASTLWQARAARDERDKAVLAGEAAAAARESALDERERAEAQAESLLAVLEFVNRTLAGARPENARGGEKTVREMLDDAARVADLSFAGRPPEVEGQVRLLLGNAYRSLSRYGEARPQLERALERLRAAEGEAGPDALRALNDLAALDAEQGFYDDAEGRYRRSVELCTHTLGQGHLRTRTARVNLAQLLRQRGDFEAAAAELERLCDEARGDDDGERRFRLFARQSLASTYAQMGELARAADGLELVLAQQRELLGADHPQTLDTASNLGSVLAGLMRVDEAERVLVETLAAQRRVLGADHVATAATEVNLAGIRLHQRRHADAIELYELALATRRARLGEAHPDTRVAGERLELARAQSALAAAGRN